MIQKAKKKFIYLLSHPFTGFGAIVFVGSMSNNVLGYVFNLIMSRALTTKDFGIFSSLNSLTYLLYIPATTLTLVITRYVAERKAKKQLDILSLIFRQYTKYFFLFGIISFLILALSSPIIASYLHVPNITLVIWLEATFVFIFSLSLIRGVMNGLLRIVGLSINIVIESFSKVVFAMILLSLGAGIISGIIPAVLAMIVSYGAGIYVLKDLAFRKQSNKTRVKDDQVPIKRLLLYAFPVFLTSFFLNSLYTNDIILVKHFFSASDAGLYSGLALAGKVVFFGSGFLAGLLFPFASFAHAKGESSKNLFIYTVITTAFLAALITGVFFLIPKTFITLFLGSKYIVVASLLGSFALFISLLAVINVFLNFFLSTMRLKAVSLPICATFAQVIGITFFHKTLSEVIAVNMAIAVVLLLSLMLYSVVVYAKK